MVARTPPNAKLVPDFTTFRTKIAPEIEKIKASQQETLLKTIYQLVKEKVEMEAARKDVPGEAKRLRRWRLRYERGLAHIENSLRDIAKARQALGDPQVPANAPLAEAEKCLDLAAHDLRQKVRDFIPASIHPALRNPKECHPAYESLVPSYPLDSLTLAAVDYWLIEQLERSLKRRRTRGKHPLGPGERNKIIARVFEVAFSENWEVTRVKTALRRITERRG